MCLLHQCSPPHPPTTTPPTTTTTTTLFAGESDWVAAMATVACELHAAFSYFNWTGFYQALLGATAAENSIERRMLVIGPYQGGLACLRIPFGKGVCGTAAQTRQTQLVPDVHLFPGHIACASSTQVRRCCCHHKRFRSDSSWLLH